CGRLKSRASPTIPPAFSTQIRRMWGAVADVGRGGGCGRRGGCAPWWMRGAGARGGSALGGLLRGAAVLPDLERQFAAHAERFAGGGLLAQVLARERDRLHELLEAVLLVLLLAHVDLGDDAAVPAGARQVLQRLGHRLGALAGQQMLVEDRAVGRRGGAVAQVDMPQLR